MTFKELNIETTLLDSLKIKGYTQPTPIQQQAIPHILNGMDILGCAQTGTGKTAAFALPILQLLNNNGSQRTKTIKALILAPTRELAIQINDSFRAYGKGLNLKSTVIFGGVSQHDQTRVLKSGVDILVATPGRLLDLMNQKYIDLAHLDILVLDEADHMLDMGFIHDIKKIVARIPAQRQTLFFSATMPPEIQKLANTILSAPVHVKVDPVSSTVDSIDQLVYLIDKKDKGKLLVHILNNAKADSSIVFTRTKHGADKLVKELFKAGIYAAAIHGNKSQGARQRALADFKKNSIQVLVATDIAARGIDINELQCVINYELPNVPETYVHRIGRTGRAGAKGLAISFCADDETSELNQIQKLIGFKLSTTTKHPYRANSSDKLIRPSKKPMKTF
jgi:ATP-dependent RNA helicase RhlE